MEPPPDHSSLLLYLPPGLRLMLAGDVESNPGPFWEKKEDPVVAFQDALHDHEDEIDDIKDLAEKQTEIITELKGKLEGFDSELKSSRTILEDSKIENMTLRKQMETQNAKFEELLEKQKVFN